MTLKFAVEKFHKDTAEKFVNEMLPLGVAHYKEIYGDDKTFNPNIPSLGMMWEAGGLSILSARDDAGALCGYAMVSVTPTPWEADNVYAMLIAHFIKKEHRGFIGKEFFKFIVEFSKGFGATGIRVVGDVGSRYERYIPKIGGKLVSNNFIIEEII